MRTAITQMLGIEHPLVAFSHSERVVVAVSRAGGLGVLGAAQLTAEELELLEEYGVPELGEGHTFGD